MGLKCKHQPPIGERATQRFERHAHLRRMVAVVVDETHCAAPAQGHLAEALQTPADALEVAQRAQNGFVIESELQRDTYGRAGVEDVMESREVERDLELGRLVPAQHLLRARDGESHLAPDVFRRDGADIEVLPGAIGHDALAHQRDDVAHAVVVPAHDGRAVEGQVFEEVDERALEPRQGMAVSFHVIDVDIGDDGDGGLKVQKRSVGLVGLDHQEIARAQPGVRARAVQPAADHECRILSGLGEHARNQTGRGCLAVRPRDRDADAF